MSEIRSHFQTELNELEVRVLEMADLAATQLNRAVDALAVGDAVAAAQVSADDREIDERYVMVEERWHEIMAQQTPVARDLRLMSFILQTSHSIERIGDQASNIARMVEVTEGLPTKESIIGQIREMASVVGTMLRTSMESLTKRDLSIALRLPGMDEPVNRLNRLMYREVAACGPDPALLEWAIGMMLVSRALERVGDRAVDIAEQVAFLLTGEFREFPEGWAVSRDE
jgi:phosphate transport system protein